MIYRAVSQTLSNGYHNHLIKTKRHYATLRRNLLGKEEVNLVILVSYIFVNFRRKIFLKEKHSFQ